MPEKKKEKLLCVDDLRHAEYYHMQNTFDDLYARSLANETFTDLMDIILSRENILLAYRNIKSNHGSRTPGTDKLDIRDIGRLQPDEVVDKVRYIIAGTPHGYRPKPVRRKDIPKPNGTTRPLGIPCIWDRLIQQCIKQVMEPICEAKFSDNSYGFRPQRSVEHAIQSTYRLIQRCHLHYIVEFDIKGFFDNVNHAKLIRQIWAMGIHDTHLIYIVRKILTAPIKMPDEKMEYPTKGTPQGGIISPLLANIVLNELDHWVDSQWQKHPVTRKYSTRKNQSGGLNFGNGYTAMKLTNLKEMRIVRYADDFRIFCRTKTDAEKAMIAITQWLQERLKLEVSPEKTRVVNVKRRYSEFLGFKIKTYPKGNKRVVKSHICDKALKKQKQRFIEQAKNVAKPRPGKEEIDEIKLYNSMVMGTQNYYKIATMVAADCDGLNRAVMTIFTNRLHRQRGSRLVRHGRKLTDIEYRLYGQSASIRYLAGSGEPIYPIGYVKHKNPIAKRRTVNPYTPEGRKEIHDSLGVNLRLMWELMRSPLHGKSTEFADNRISLFSAQWGKCAITGKSFCSTSDIHCHHKTPKSKGGTDAYCNLILVLEPVHKLIHATEPSIISKYLQILDLSEKQLKKLNYLRTLLNIEIIAT